MLTCLRDTNCNYVINKTTKTQLLSFSHTCQEPCLGSQCSKVQPQTSPIINIKLTPFFPYLSYQLVNIAHDIKDGRDIQLALTSNSLDIIYKLKPTTMLLDGPIVQGLVQSPTRTNLPIKMCTTPRDAGSCSCMEHLATQRKSLRLNIIKWIQGSTT